MSAPSFRAFAILPVILGLVGVSHASDWGTVVTISTTMGVNDGRVCVGEATRGDIGCPTYAPQVLPDGTVSATGFAGDGAGLTGITAESTDRITSGTTRMVAVSNTGFISVTQAGSNSAWFDPTRGLVTLGVSATGVVSAVTVSTNGLRTQLYDTTLWYIGNETVSTGIPTSDGATIQYRNDLFGTVNEDGLLIEKTDGNGNTPDGGILFANRGIDGVRRPALAIRGNGNVGIGTLAPNSPLEVNGAVRVAGGGSTGYLGLFTTTTLSPTSNSGTPGDAVVMGPHGGNLAFDLRNDGYSDAIVFRYSVANNGLLDKVGMVFRGDGRVGIGVISPTVNLEVSGTVSATRFVGDGSQLTGVVAAATDRIMSGTTSIVAVSSTGFISVTQAGSNVAWFDPTRGLVTLGVSASGAISGTNGYFGSDVVVSGSLIVSGGRAGITLRDRSDPRYSILYRAASKTHLWDSDSGGNRLTIDNASGFIGIGTANPAGFNSQLAVNVASPTTAALYLNTPNLGTISAFTVMAPLSTDLNTGKLFSFNAVGEGMARGVFYSDGSYGLGNGTALRDIFVSRLTTSTLLISSDRGTGGGALRVTSWTALNMAATPTAPLEVSGTVSATRFVGDGSGLTNLQGASADRVVSGTTRLVAISTTGFISVTQAGSNSAWFDPTRGLVTLGVSTTGPISGTYGYFRNGIRTNDNIVVDDDVSYRGIVYRTSGANRWQVTANSQPETGSNAGSDFFIQKAIDDGTWSSIPLYIRRDTSDIYFSSKVGIGLSSSVNPSATLHATGSARITSWTMVNANTTPTAPLEVSGTVSATRFVGDGSLLTNLQGASTDRIVSGTTSLAAISNTGFISLTQAGSNSAWFDPLRGLVALGVSATGAVSATRGYFSGSVGVGTLNPSAEFEVSGVGVFTDRVSIGSTTTVTNPMVALNSGPAQGYIGIYGGNRTLYAGTTSGDKFSLITSNTERMSINSNGLIGIGTSNPAANLEVNGTVSSSDLYVRGRIDVVTGTYVTGVGALAAQASSGTHVTALGYAAALSNSGTAVTAAGTNAARNSRGDGVSAFGVEAAYNNSSALVTAFGAYSAAYNSGSTVTAVGYASGQYNKGSSNVLVGSFSGQNNSGTNVVFIGRDAGKTNQAGQTTGIGVSAGLGSSGDSSNFVGAQAGQNSSGAYTQALGNAAAFGNSGQNVVGVGHGAAQGNSGNNVTAIGNLAGFRSGVSNTFSNVTLLGSGTRADKDNQVVLGAASVVEVSTAGVLLSAGVSTSGVVTATAFVGDGSRLTNLSIAGDRIVSGSTGIYVHSNSSATIATGGVERMVIGANGRVGIGKSSPAAALDVSGTVSATYVKLADNDDLTCTPERNGTLRFSNGIVSICRAPH